MTNPTFSWALGAGGTGSATINQPAKDSIAVVTNFKSTSTRGATDSVQVIPTVRNACGVANSPKYIPFKLKPRELYKGDTIAGSLIICESQLYAPFSFGRDQPNTTQIKWSWNNTEQVLMPEVKDVNDTAWISKTAWGDISAVTQAVVGAQLGNECGYGKDTTLAVAVIPSVDFDFNVVSDKVQNSFCVPTETVGVWAQQTLPDSNGVIIAPYTYGNIASYQFTDAAGNILQPLSPRRGLVSPFKGDTVLYVTGRPSPGACLNPGSEQPKTRTIALRGYDRPKDTVAAVRDTICDTEGSVPLAIASPSRDAGTITWYREWPGGDRQVAVGPSHGVAPVRDSSGVYYAVIQNALKQVRPGADCPDATSRKVPVRVYDTPAPAFTADPLLIYYDQASPGVPMPLATTGTADTLIWARYDNGTWLSSQDSLVPVIKTTQDEVPMEYTLRLETGNRKAGAVCPGEAKITVLNTLPLFIPNAFSPNQDGQNDTWVIKGLGRYPNTKVKVFNRWGSEMFVDNNGYRATWDGMHNGAPLPVGTYYYVVELKGSPDNSDESHRGTLTIVR